MKAQVVFIDYLQLLADGKAKDRYQAITGISIALHELWHRPLASLWLRWLS